MGQTCKYFEAAYTMRSTCALEIKMAIDAVEKRKKRSPQRSKEKVREKVGKDVVCNVNCF